MSFVGAARFVAAEVRLPGAPALAAIDDCLIVALAGAAAAVDPAPRLERDGVEVSLEATVHRAHSENRAVSRAAQLHDRSPVGERDGSTSAQLELADRAEETVA